MRNRKNFLRFLLLFLLAAVIAGGCGSGAVPKLSQIMSFAGQRMNAQCISADRYVHNTLDEEQQEVYDQMLDAILNFRDSVILSPKAQEDVQRCYEAICADYGEIFWVDSCSCSELSWLGKVRCVKFSVTYRYSEQETEDYQRQMQPVIDEYLNAMAACDSDYEKSLTLYRSLIRNVDYDLDSENNQNILSVFLGERTVCQGYACAVQYLLHEAGIDSVIVTGSGQGQSHAWNLVKLDGDYYYMDVTWGTADYSGTVATEKNGINYGYLNITTEELLRNHSPQVDFPLEECTQTKDNYYVREELFFDAWDLDGMGEKLTDAFLGGEESVSLKFSQKTLYEQAEHYLIQDQHITDYCPGIEKIYYVPDDDLNILTIYF
jgi:hypothetical protein